MASCKTTQWATGSPYVRLTVTESASTSTTSTLSWQLHYIAASAASTSVNKAYTVTIAGETVKTGSFDIDGKTGTVLVDSGTKKITKSSSTKTVSFGVSFTFNLTWSGSYASTLSASGNVSVAAETVYTACGVPTSLSIVDNGNNTATLSCKIGTNGTNNTTDGVELYITCDESAPTTGNFNYKVILDGVASGTVTKVLSFVKLSKTTMSNLLGTDLIGTIKFTARTTGDAGSKYYSAVATTKSATFTWHDKAIAPSIVTPLAKGETTGLLSSYKVSWTAGASGINNALTKYSIRVYDMTLGTDVATYITTGLYYSVPASIFTAGHVYRFYIKTIGASTGFDSAEAMSGPLTIKNISKLPNIAITASEGNTVSAIEFFDYDVYADIGSGTVAKLSWSAPTAANNEVDYYGLKLVAFDSDSGSYVTLLDGSIGNVTEFYIQSSLLSAVSVANYRLDVTLTAHSRYGTAYNSTGTLSCYISDACGTYLKVENGYKQPIMKRTIAFAKLGYRVLKDEEGKVLTDEAGFVLYGKVSDVQDNSNGWTPMQEFYSKTVNGDWKASDIRYELLVDSSGEAIKDSNNEYIYTL